MEKMFLYRPIVSLRGNSIVFDLFSLREISPFLEFPNSYIMIFWNRESFKDGDVETVRGRCDSTFSFSIGEIRGDRAELRGDLLFFIMNLRESLGHLQSSLQKRPYITLRRNSISREISSRSSTRRRSPSPPLISRMASPTDTNFHCTL